MQNCWLFYFKGYFYKANLELMDATKYLELFRDKLLEPTNFTTVNLTRQWANTMPSSAGVYIFKENGKIVYVGETGNLRRRMKDLLDSRHHNIRRTIGAMYYSNIGGFLKATNKIKFPPHIEILVNDHIIHKMEFGYPEVSLGRKELEKMIEKFTGKDIRLNNRGKRKSD